jgi:hypothetical protein
MRLLEVVRGETTSDRTLSTAYAIARNFAKFPFLLVFAMGSSGIESLPVTVRQQIPF